MAVRPFRLSVGRKRVTKVVTPAEASYIRNINAQLKQIEQNFADFVEHIDEQTPEILDSALRPTFEKSQRYTPRLTGALVRSGYLETVKTSQGAVAELGYGRGGNPPYTVFVHERLELKHKAPTRAKFLQSALQEDAGRIEKRIVDLTTRAAGL